MIIPDLPPPPNHEIESPYVEPEFYSERIPDLIYGNSNLEEFDFSELIEILSVDESDFDSKRILELFHEICRSEECDLSILSKMLSVQSEVLAGFPRKEIQKYLAYPKKAPRDLIFDVAMFGHSRYLLDRQIKRYCWNYFGHDYQNITSEEWVRLKSTTFPLSILSKYEQKIIGANWENIFLYASNLGWSVVTIYLLIKRKEEKDKHLCIHSDGGDVSINGGVIDKRRGTFIYIQDKNGKNIETQKIESNMIEVGYNPSEDCAYKAITIVIEPDSGKYHAFPRNLQYLQPQDASTLSSSLSREMPDLKICQAVHLLGVLAPYAQQSVGQLVNLKKHPNSIVRSTVLDVLGEIGTDEAVQELINYLSNTPADGEHDIAISSLEKGDGLYQRLLSNLTKSVHEGSSRNTITTLRVLNKFMIEPKFDRILRNLDNILNFLFPLGFLMFFTFYLLVWYYFGPNLNKEKSIIGIIIYLIIPSFLYNQIRERLDSVWVHLVFACLWVIAVIGFVIFSIRGLTT